MAERTPSETPSWARDDEDAAAPKPSGASTVLRAGRRGWAEFRQNCLAILKLVTVLTSCLVAFANVYAIARARSPRLALVDDVRLGCASAFALLVVCVEGESRVVLRELALLERSFLAKGLLLAYIGVTTWDEDRGLVELGNIAAMLCWACGGVYALLAMCCCGSAAAAGGAPKGEVYEAIPEDDEEQQPLSRGAKKGARS